MHLRPSALAGVLLLPLAATADVRELPAGWSILGVGADTSTDDVVLTTAKGPCASGCTWPEAIEAGVAGHPHTWIWDGATERYRTPDVKGLTVPAMHGAWLHVASPVTVSIGREAPVPVAARKASNEPDLVLGGRAWTLDWSDEFGTLSIEDWGSDSGARWFASTPWGGDFGDARFVDEAASVADGSLVIEANTSREPGTWTSSLLSLRHPSGRGRTWRGGYFEARMDLPEGPGTWPAFWLGLTKGLDGHGAEIDVIEHYGHAPDEYHAVAHTWRPGHEDDHPWSRETIVHAPGIAARGWLTVGVEVTPAELVYYLDRREVWRVARPAEWDGLEFYPIVNLALGSGWPIHATPDPSVLLVDYVRVYLPER